MREIGTQYFELLKWFVDQPIVELLSLIAAFSLLWLDNRNRKRIDKEERERLAQIGRDERLKITGRLSGFLTLRETQLNALARHMMLSQARKSLIDAQKAISGQMAAVVKLAEDAASGNAAPEWSITHGRTRQDIGDIVLGSLLHNGIELQNLNFVEPNDDMFGENVPQDDTLKDTEKFCERQRRILGAAIEYCDKEILAELERFKDGSKELVQIGRD